MKTTKQETETYILTELDRLDPITVYITNYGQGKGKIVIECYGSAWSSFWGGMSNQTIQKFLLTSDNPYLLNCFLKETMQTDFEEITRISGGRICADTNFDLAMGWTSEMRDCFGDYRYMELPACLTDEYKYLSRILDAIKTAFAEEIEVVESAHKED
jgi:hypothetical protein